MSKEQHETKQAMAAELNRMAKKNGGKITPRMVVDAARDEDSPLHSYFEWDDAIAAEKYREMQARTLLRSVDLKVTKGTVKFDVSAYIRDPESDPQEQGYVQVSALKSQEDLARDALIAEFKRASALIERARRYAAFFGMEESLDDLAAQVDTLRGSIESSAANSQPA
jgi:hypothetical protein